MSDRAFTTMGVFDDADDEIKRLRAENERLQDALDRCIEARLARLGLAGDDQ